jgi:hypothetical protein
VTAGVDVILRSTGTTVGGCTIGHINALTNVPPIAVSGDTTVIAGRNLWIDASQHPGAGGNKMGIGHSYFPGSNTSGNITVRVGNDINMIGYPSAGGNLAAFIGHCDLGAIGVNPPLSITNSTLFVQACRDINLDPRLSGRFGIGAQIALRDLLNSPVIVFAGRDINILPTTANGGIATVIGYNPTTVLGVMTTSTNVTAGRNITITSGGGSRSAGIGGKGNVFVAAQGNITLTAVGGSNYFIGTDDVTGSLFTTTIISNGNVVGINPAVGVGQAVFGRNPALPVGPYSLNLRAAGNVQLSTGYTVNGAATIFMEADTNLAAGQLWAAGGMNACAVFMNASTAVFPDNLGSVSVNKATAATVAITLKTNS